MPSTLETHLERVGPELLPPLVIALALVEGRLLRQAGVLRRGGRLPEYHAHGGRLGEKEAGPGGRGRGKFCF